MPTITFWIKEVEEQNLDTSMPSIHSSSMPTILTIEKDGSIVHIGQEENIVPTPQTQGES